MTRLHFAALAAAVILFTPSMAHADRINLTDWPDPDSLSQTRGERVTYPSHSPFTLWKVGKSEALDPPTDARATLFIPDGTSPESPAPAVVLLHGAAGVLGARELTYGAQFAEMGVAALVVDAFGARRDKASGFIDRLLNITETMLIADAYAGLRYLNSLREVDGSKVALMGFSYGGMSTMLAAFEQTAAALSRTAFGFRPCVLLRPLSGAFRQHPRHRCPGAVAGRGPGRDRRSRSVQRNCRGSARGRGRGRVHRL